MAIERTEQEYQWKMIEEQRIIAENNPADIEALLGYSWLLVVGGACISRELAWSGVEIGRQAARDFPDSGLVHRQLGVVLQTFADHYDCLADHMDEIEAEFKLGRSLEPEYQQSCQWLADAFWKLGRYREALAELEQHSRPDDRVVARFVRVYLSMGDIKAAVPFIEKALELNQEPKHSLNYSPWLENLHEAALFYKDSEQANSAALETFARIYFSRGGNATALHLVNNALSIESAEEARARLKSLRYEICQKGIVSLIGVKKCLDE